MSMFIFGCFFFWDCVILGPYQLVHVKFGISSWRGSRVDGRSCLLSGAIDGSEGNRIIRDSQLEFENSQRQEVWNDCKSCKVRVGSNGNLLWEASVLLGGVRVAREDDRGVTEGREDVREVFQQRRSGAKRKLSRCGRNQLGNEPILALPEGANDFVVYYEARSKNLDACLEKGRRLWVVKGLTLERCSTFGKKDKLELSYVGPFEILGWFGPIVRLRISV
ncbi:hypothetical protein Tco_0010792 [Tanacetum coccineum]